MTDDEVVAVARPTLDRLSESAVFVGLIFFYASSARPYEALLAAMAMTFSLLTSYARARAEALGLRGDVGLGSRAERVVVITTGLCLAPLHDLILPSTIALLTATAWLTVLQRILFVRKQLRGI